MPVLIKGMAHALKSVRGIPLWSKVVGDPSHTASNHYIARVLGWKGPFCADLNG